ncbi:hypothetical protein H0H93_014657, partial [Arthromyces matolae]
DLIPSFPGPPSPDSTPQTCVGRFFTTMGAGPFPTYSKMARWFQNRLLVIQHCFKEGLGASPFDSSVPLVFTHLDLHPSNIILGDDGQLWVIDWADAGWYPSWFESASMVFFCDSGSLLPYMETWSKWVTFIAGDCEQPGQLPFMKAIGRSFEAMPPNIVNLAQIDQQNPESDD